MASYAQELENRVIIPRWFSKYRRVGRFAFRSLYDGSNQMNFVGKEMTTYVRYRMEDAPVEAERGWIFRTYWDGTAFFRKYKFDYMMRTYNVRQSVWEIIQQYFYIDTTIEHGSYENQVIVLRRKPLSDYARLLDNAEGNLGDFLIQKYNIGKAVST